MMIIGMSFLDPVEGLVEFKKYKVTNSDKVCGDKLYSKVDEKIASQGRSFHDIKICGLKLYSDKSLETSRMLMECKIGQQLVVKATTLAHACVNTSSVEKLRDNGWAISEQNQHKIFGDDVLITNDARPSITSSDLSNQRYLVIDGYGWHRLHNVGITISSLDFEESFRSQTTDNGDLNTLWPIPDLVGGKVYNIFATDGIHEFELNIPITS